MLFILTQIEGNFPSKWKPWENRRFATLPVNLDLVYTVPDLRSHDIEIGWFAVTFNLTTF